MKSEPINACIRHWLDRVELGDIAFRFKSVQESDLRASQSKKKRPAPPSDDESEEHSQRNRHSLASGSRRPVDGHDSDEEEPLFVKSDEKNTRSGKLKALPLLW
jgi:hypothetical protein